MTRLTLSAPAMRMVVTLTVLAVAAVVAYLAFGPSQKHAVAYFNSVKSIYPKDHIKIKGVDVGQITAITPEPGRVKVEFSYNGRYSLPLDVKAAIVSPTLVSTRFIQLAPAYVSGPALADDAVIPIERTASPLEFDDLKTELARLANGLGPNGVDKNGALSRFLNVAARNGQGGNGQRFNDLIHQASSALDAIDSSSGDLFGTVNNLQVFVNTLSQVDSQIQEFNNRLGSVSATLDDNKDELASALDSVSRAAHDIDGFVRTNGDTVNKSVDQLGQFTRTVAGQRDNLATLLHIGPNTLMNVFNIFSPSAQALQGMLEFDNLNTPADFVCSAYSESTGSNAAASQRWCTSYLNPLLNVLRTYQPPLSVNPLARQGNGGPVKEPGDYDANPAVPDHKPQLPPPPPKLPGLGGLTFPSGGN